MSGSALAKHGTSAGRPTRSVVLALVLAVAAVGCSSDSDGTAASTTTEAGATTSSTAPSSTTTSTTTAGEDATTSTTGADDPTTTTAATEPADPNAPPPQDYSGAVDAQDGDTTISFVRGADVSSVEIRALEVTCEPIDNTGATRTEAVDLSFPDVEVAEDGSVEVAKPDDELSPSLSGVFAADGTFTGSIFLSFERGGYACGGDYPFTAAPG